MTVPRNRAAAGRAVVQIIKRSTKGSATSVRTEFERASRIGHAIWDRWQAGPWRWKQKYVRWFLTTCASKYSSWTRYRYWLTLKRVLKATGKLEDWRPQLNGPWTRPSKRVSRKVE